MVKIKLKKYIVDFSAASFAYMLLTEIGQHITDTDTIHTKIRLFYSIYNVLPNLKLYTYWTTVYISKKKRL